MIPELGHFALIVALLLALIQAILPLYGAQRGNLTLMAVARPAAQGQFVFVAVAFACLAYSFLTNDFSVVNVARNSFSQLPEVYRLTATWGSHEGSLLLWVLMLAFWSTAVSVFSRHLPEDMVARVLGVMGLITVGFLSFLLFTSNPFERLLPAADGRPRPESAAAGPGHDDPPADALHGLRRLFGRLRLRHRRAAVGRLDAPGRAGRGPGPRRRGSSSPSASRSAAGGPTTSWAGAAGGSGIRWRTPRSCPGSSAPR